MTDDGIDINEVEVQDMRDAGGAEPSGVLTFAVVAFWLAILGGLAVLVVSVE